MPHFRKASLWQPGFHFPNSEVFPSPTVSQGIYTVLVEHAAGGAEDVRHDLQAARTVVGSKITELFELCNHNNTLLLAFRGHQDDFFKMLASQSAFESQEIPLVLAAFCTARQAYRGNQKTYLTGLVDQWMEVYNQAAALPPSTTLALTVRQTPFGAALQDLQGLQISAQSVQWPPAHLNPKEVSWVMDSRIVGDLNGLTAQTVGSVGLQPTPGSESSPLELKRYLCTVALTLPEQERHKLAIYLAPLTTEKVRREWYHATGSLSKVYEPMSEFVAYARDALEARAKSIVAGVFCHWTGQPAAWLTYYEQAPRSQSRADFWSSHYDRATVCIAVYKNDGQELVLVLFDPRIQYQHLRRQPTMTGHLWKEQLMSQLEQGFNSFAARYHGGLVNGISEEQVAELDEVNLCCLFISNVATGQLSDNGYSRAD